MSKFGFKEITIDNWLKTDDLFSASGKNNEENKFIPMSGEEWVEIVLDIKLSESVPFEVKKLYEVAKGAYIYSFFFYSLHTLGAEQVFRVAETALKIKCKSLNLPRSIKTFESRIDYLHYKSIFSKIDLKKWHAIRKLKNSSSHPKSQTIFSPSMSIESLKSVQEHVNRLFNDANLITNHI